MASSVLHPSRFQVNEAWIAFQLNETSIRTETEGNFNCIAFMDAASCFILCSELVPANRAEPSKLDVRRLLKKGWAHRKESPKTLFVPSGQFTKVLPAEAKRQGIAVVRVPAEKLLVFIGEARSSFKEHLAGGGVQ